MDLKSLWIVMINNKVLTEKCFKCARRSWNVHHGHLCDWMTFHEHPSKTLRHSEQNIAEGKIVLMCVMLVGHQFDVCDAAWTI